MIIGWNITKQGESFKIKFLWRRDLQIWKRETRINPMGSTGSIRVSSWFLKSNFLCSLSITVTIDFILTYFLALATKGLEAMTLQEQRALSAAGSWLLTILLRQKNIKTPWRNGRFQGWGKEDTREAWNILLCQKVTKVFKNEGDTGPSQKSGMIWGSK